MTHVLHRSNMQVYGGIKLYAGTGSPALAARVAEYLGEPLREHDVVEFPNENIFVKLRQSVRGQDVYLIQTTTSPVHRNLMELLITIQTLRLDSAARITAVVPYLAYGRSDKKDQPRVPITARLVADMIEVAGADRYVTFDPHAGQIQGFFSIPGDVLTTFHIITEYHPGSASGMVDPVVVSGPALQEGRNIAELAVPTPYREAPRRQRWQGGVSASSATWRATTSSWWTTR
jgi:ribose-phosphate pyrophosphokinase